MAGQGISYILRALGANFAIAVAKGVGAFLTGSGAMLAETLHLLDPLGQGRNLYFWSFMVAMLLFLGGGAYSVYEGIHKLRHPQPLASPMIAIGILGFGLAVEGWAMAGALKVVRERKGDRSLLRYLRETKDSDLVVIFGEDFAAVVGLALALIAIAVSWMTGDPMWDSVGTLAIGAVLICAAARRGRRPRARDVDRADRGGGPADPEGPAHTHRTTGPRRDQGRAQAPVPQAQPEQIANLEAVGTSLGLDHDRLSKDLQGCQSWLQSGQRELAAVGINATPAFFVNGRPLRERTFAAFDAMVAKELAKANSGGVAAADYYQREIVAKGLTQVKSRFSD